MTGVIMSIFLIFFGKKVKQKHWNFKFRKNALRNQTFFEYIYFEWKIN